MAKEPQPGLPSGPREPGRRDAVRRTSPAPPRQEPQNLADILGQLIVARGWGRASERRLLEDAWEAVVPPEMRSETRVSRLQRGILEIDVRSGVLLQELAQFHKRSLLQALRQKLPRTPITDLKFRAANW